MAVLYTNHFIQFFDDEGAPLAGGKLYTYQAGTTTPKATYTTAAGTVENDNPVELDSQGRAVIFLVGAYKFALTDSSGVPVGPNGGITDNVTAFTTSEDATINDLSGIDEGAISIADDFFIFQDVSSGNATKKTNLGSVALLNSHFPRGHIAGLTISNNGSDASHDIDIAAGECRYSDNTGDYILSSVLTKRMDATFAAGTGSGGQAVALPTSGTFHIFAITQDSNGAADIMGDTSVTGANVPSGWTVRRRIGSVKTDGSANIIGFSQLGDEFLLNVPASDVNTNNPGTSAILSTLTVPSGLKVMAIVTVGLLDNTAGARYLLVTSPDQTDTTPSTSAFTLRMGSSGNSNTDSTVLRVRTNTSSQIRYRLDASEADNNVRIHTHGWIDDRGRFN